jgi:GNAT superfamily N-acetyltransferase
LRVALTRSAEEFAARAGALLQAGPETNIHATVLGSLRADPDGAGAALFATVEEGGEVVALALRTPPWPLLASGMQADAADALMQQWLREDAGVPGLVAPQPAASHIAAAWERLSGRRASVATEEAAHRLERVLAPARPAAGALRQGREVDRPLLVRWSTDFAREARVPHSDPERSVERGLETGELCVWEDGVPVCMVGVHMAVAGVVRLGPVYTPPDRRGHGYATSAVAAASEAALARGAHACMLFTDLANPTSNRIYAAVGYERFADWREYRFASAP